MSTISIIIPTYNRAHLIAETLDSILAQTYLDWECILIDDGSTDITEQVVDQYATKDNRFIFLKRPKNKPKGANACRNIGLENATGDYIVFFDSDDLMTPDHLAVKLNVIQQNQSDYIITRTQYFNADNSEIDKYYQGYNDFKITPFNYVSKKINWLTLDVCIKRSIAQSIRFNEKLQSGQEYNYYCKLVHHSANAVFIDKIVSLRRAHDGSIRSQLKTKSKLNQSFFNANWYTYIDINAVANKNTRLYLLQRIAFYILSENHFYGKSIFKVMNVFYKEIGFNTTYLFLYIYSNRLFNKGDIFREKFKKSVFL